MTPHTEAELRGDLELLRRVVAEMLGWELLHEAKTTPMGRKAGSDWEVIPRYEASLDACRLFQKGLTEEDEKVRYHWALMVLSMNQNCYTWELSPVDHCIAFLRIRNVITPTTPQ